MIGTRSVVRVSDVRIPGSFKRFGSLEIHSLGPEVELVVMLGPNGSGKSSVFDAFLEWARHRGRPRKRSLSNEYFDSETGRFGKPEVILHTPNIPESSEPPGPLVHVRTAHRNTPDVLADSVRKQEEFRERSPFERMTDTDVALGEHYQRLVARFLPVLSNLESGDAAGDLEAVRDTLLPVQDSLVRVFPHLRFAGLGNPTSDGSFYFTRDDVRGFRYENLSGGEKAVFDLLLDVHIAATELGTPLVCLDEPEIHLNPAVQSAVLTELMSLLFGRIAVMDRHSLCRDDPSRFPNLRRKSRPSCLLELRTGRGASARCPTGAVSTFVQTPARGYGRSVR